MRKSIHLATVRTDGKIYHIVPNGNRHAKCGVVATNEAYGPDAGRNCAALTHRLCKNCMRVKPVRDGMAAPTDEPTDTWVVTNKAGERLGRVTARDIRCASRIANQNPTVARVSRREGGISLRRLRTSEL
jgi:hypothetical protein